jgi:hypothetical protein
MGFLGSPYRRRPRRFEQVEEEQDHRIHFRNLSPYQRDRGRSLIWMLVMVGFVIFMIYYLSKV